MKRITVYDKGHRDSPLSRIFGVTVAGVLAGGTLLAAVLLLAAVIAGLLRFISWAVGA